MKNIFADQRSITFLISLLIASGLWLLIKLSGDFQTNQQVRLEFTNFPVDKVLINKPDSLLQVKTDNNGFDALRQYLFNRNKTITIDLSRAKHLDINSKVQKYYILSSSLYNEIEEEFKTAEQILNIEPDSILLLFENLASKKVKIEPQLELSYNPRFKPYSKMSITPDSVLLFGPVSQLKSIQSIKTKLFTFHNINIQVDTLLTFVLPGDKLKSKTTTTELKIDVEEYTEGKLELPIQMKGNNKIRYKIFPSVAQVTYQVALKDYAKITPSSFRLQAVPDALETGKLQLQLSQQPENIIVTNIQPATAEYIIIR
ncbi:MAG: hypothetical protein JW857_04735 [Bacteroidales bacterium]|nr:hypothetical protein [Bacteroidales bacterium]